MDNLLAVWIYPEGQQVPVLCGSLECVQGRRCFFSYDEGWLRHPNAFALCPDMPLRKGIFEPPAGLDLHPIFEDAGPDRWGKNIINKVFNPIRRSPLEFLEFAGEERIGALGFSRSATVYQVLPEESFYIADLPELMRAAHELANQMPVDASLRRLLRPGASAGGARPKAIIKHQGMDWLAKFSDDDDDCDVCAIEHASLKLAANCGIVVPESQLIQIGRKNVLLVKRFDRVHGSRVHYASARSILFAEGIAEEAMSYADLADALRRLSSAPKKDCQELFRRMVLNVLIENTDDHAKNHALLYSNGYWRLSPVFDIQPQRQGIGYQQLRIGIEGHVATLANVRSEAGRFMQNAQEAEALMEGVVQQVRDWQNVFAQAGVSQRDIALCGRYVLGGGADFTDK